MTHTHVNPYPLVKLWKITILNGWINYKWQFPIPVSLPEGNALDADLRFMVFENSSARHIYNSCLLMQCPRVPLGWNTSATCPWDNSSMSHLKKRSQRTLGIQVPNISRVIFGVVHPISACKGSKGKGITPMPKFHSKDKNNNVFLSGMSVSLLATKKMWTCLPSIHSLLQHLRFHRWTNDGSRRSSYEACMTGILTGIPKHLNYSEPQGPS